MKKRIDGKLYDTETATKVGIWYSDYARSDFNYFQEELYRKKTGEYFIFGWGNAASRYAEQVESNGWGSGERIMPITRDEAVEWAEKHLTVEECDAEFGPVPESDDETVPVTYRLPLDVVAKLRTAASVQGRPQSEILAAMMRLYL